MDVKEGMDIDSSSGFVPDPLIDMLAIEHVVTYNLARKRACTSPAEYYADDNAGDHWEEYDFDPEEEREGLSENYLFFRYAGSTPIETTQAACEHLCDICFWRPIYMWFRGECYDGQWVNDQVYPPPAHVKALRSS
ncbi:hypothetical protein C84B14_16010 [Salinisphaera sp. C84B14]